MVEILGVEIGRRESGEWPNETVADAGKLVVILLVLGWFIPMLADRLMRGQHNVRVSFWTHQGVRIAVTLLLIPGSGLYLV